MIHPSLHVAHELLEDVCRRYRIRELSVFGSATRSDFRPDSDVDLLVEYESGGEPTFLTYPKLRDELQRLFGREIDLIEGRDSLVNPYRRQDILGALERLYAA